MNQVTVLQQHRMSTDVTVYDGELYVDIDCGALRIRRDSPTGRIVAIFANGEWCSATVGVAPKEEEK